MTWLDDEADWLYVVDENGDRIEYANRSDAEASMRIWVKRGGDINVRVVELS